MNSKKFNTCLGAYALFTLIAFIGIDVNFITENVLYLRLLSIPFTFIVISTFYAKEITQLVKEKKELEKLGFSTTMSLAEKASTLFRKILGISMITAIITIILISIISQ